MAIPLEDKFNDIVGKAMRGLQLSDSQVAQKSGADADAVLPVATDRSSPR